MSQIPGYVWMNALALVVVAGGLVAARSRRRRLAEFGDAAVLGAANHAWARLISVLLTAGAAACLAGILTMHPGNRQAPGGPGGFQLIIDRQLLEEPAVQPSNSISATIRAVVGQAPPCPISVAVTGDPPETLIPPTRDVQGLLMLTDSVMVSRTFRGPASKANAAVYLTAQQEVADTGSESAFVRQGPPLVFGVRAADGNVQWSEDPAGFREFLESASIRTAEVKSRLPRLSMEEGLALLAFSLLAAGFAWTCFR